MKSSTGTALLVALVSFALALAVRLVGIGSSDIWLDELYTQFAVSREWYGLAADRISRGHSPLYYGVMKAMGIAGENVMAMRTAATVFDSAAAAVLSGAVALLIGARSALFFGLLYAFSPVAIHWAQNARPYGLLMLFIAIGLSGAMALLATLGRDEKDGAIDLRWPQRIFGIGFSFASLTLTAGIFAFVTVAVAPWLLPRTRRDKPFMARWRRAVKWPAVVSVLAYFLISGPHVARQVDGYWAEKYNSFGIEGLSNLWVGMLVDNGGRVALAQATSWQVLPVLLWAMTLCLLFFAAAGIRAAAARPALLAPAFVAVGYSLLLVVLSAWTSLLVARYFLPAWIALLVLSGAGMGQLLPRRWPLLLMVPFLALHIAVGIAQSIEQTKVRERSLQPAITIIGRVPPETVRILYQQDVVDRSELTMETFALRFDRSELERPYLRSFRVDRLEEALASGGDTFALLSPKRLAAVMADGVDSPLCVQGFGAFQMAYWGTNDAACAP